MMATPKKQLCEAIREITGKEVKDYTNKTVPELDLILEKEKDKKWHRESRSEKRAVASAGRASPKAKAASPKSKAISRKAGTASAKQQDALNVQKRITKTRG